MEGGPAHRGANLIVQPFLDFQRTLTLRRVAWVQRRIGPGPFDVVEHRGRVFQNATLMAQDGHCLLAEARQQLHRMRAGKQRMPDVGHTLVIQRPARLLRIHREAELPEFRVTHDRSPMKRLDSMTSAVRGADLREDQYAG
jgi:hypothetical protein